MLFLKFSNVNIFFGDKILIKRFYISNEALITTQQIEIINLKKFVIMALYADNKIFLVNIAI